jgi:FtsP/CotA-like multicopper oxidase with cupredoxin domain
MTITQSANAAKSGQRISRSSWSGKWLNCLPESDTSGNTVLSQGQTGTTAWEFTAADMAATDWTSPVTP